LNSKIKSRIETVLSDLFITQLLMTFIIWIISFHKP